MQINTADALYPWQQPLWMQLNARLQDDSLAHAILITAEPGMGQHDFAIRWVNVALCSNANACLQCRSCQLVKSESHPDLHILDLEPDAKFIKIEQVRKLTASLCQKPQFAQRHVVLIHNADKMTLAAANSLLKILEEPITDTHFVLLANNCRQLLPTIFSRCQHVRLQAPFCDALDWLQTQNIAAPRAEQLLKAAGGGPLVALAMLDSDFLSIRDSVVDDIIILLQGQLSVVNIATKWQEHAAPTLLDILYNILNDLLKLSHYVDESNINYSDLYEKLTSVLQYVRAGDLLELLKPLRLLARESNINRQLLLENFLICCLDLRK